MALPLHIEIERDGHKTNVVIRRLERSVDKSLLADMTQRFPTYRMLDVADYREALHDHGPKRDGTGHSHEEH